MVYLGLVDDEYDDYDEYGPRAQATPRVGAHQQDEVEASEAPPSVAGGTIRPMIREEPSSPQPISPSRSSAVRTLVPDTSAKVHVVAPVEFADARQIADRLMASQPVIVNLQVADRELMRRMIDFCSGAAYALSGKMERVADKVFLMTPSNVKVSAEERLRLRENGLLRS